MPSCHAAARPGARSSRTPRKHSISQSCSNTSTPHATAWSSSRSYSSASCGCARSPSIHIANSSHVRRLRRQVPAVRDERAPVEALAQHARRRRAARRRAAPSAPCRSAERPTRRCRTGAAPRAGTTTSRAAPRRRGTPRASRSSTAATTVDAASSPGSVRYQYALPLSVQYDRRVPSTSASRAGAGTPDADRRSRAQRAKQSRAPSPAMIASSVAKPAAHVVDVAVPARRAARRRPAPCPAGTAITCSWNDCSGASSNVRPSGATRPERHHHRRPERQQPPARHRRVAEHRQRELGVLVAERAQTRRARRRRPGASGSKCHATAGVANSPVAKPLPRLRALPGAARPPARPRARGPRRRPSPTRAGSAAAADARGRTDPAGRDQPCRARASRARPSRSAALPQPSTERAADPRSACGRRSRRQARAAFNSIVASHCTAGACDDGECPLGIALRIRAVSALRVAARAAPRRGTRR